MARRGASLAQGLGWFSLGLGLAAVVAPWALARAVAVTDNPRARIALRALGARELASGAAILAGRTSPGPVWSRVLGDAIDLAVLGLALRARRTNTPRALVAMAAVAGVAALDVFTALRLRRSIAVAKPVRASVTINRTPVQVYAAWRNLHDLPRYIDSLSAVRPLEMRRSRWTAKAPAGLTVEWDAELVDDRPGERIAWRTMPGSDVEHEGSVTFRAAPGQRGTEVHWEMRRGGRGARGGGRRRGLRGAQDGRRPPALQAGDGDRGAGALGRERPPGDARRAAVAGEGRAAVMRATLWMGKKDVRVEHVPDPTILDPGDAIVTVSSTAICGSDLHLFNGFVPTMEKGDILGHEFMGEVVEVGRGVKKLHAGDRVVVPFPIACGSCAMCQAQIYSCCEDSNPNAAIAEKMLGHSPAGIFGYSHMLGAYAGGQAEYARVPFADVGPLKVPAGMSDEQVLFLSDILPTGYMGAEMCDIKPGQVVVDWGCGPVGQFAIAIAKMLGAERIIAIDRFGYRLDMAASRAGATDVINYEERDVAEALLELTGGRGPDACIDAVGMEAHGHGVQYAYDRAKQIAEVELDRPIVLREAIRTCRNGGTVSVIGVYGGFIDRFPMNAVMNRSLTIRSGQCHVHRYMQPLLVRIERGEIDPSFIITHRMTLDQAPQGYDLFLHKQDQCMKVVLSA